MFRANGKFWIDYTRLFPSSATFESHKNATISSSPLFCIKTFISLSSDNCASTTKLRRFYMFTCEIYQTFCVFMERNISVLVLALFASSNSRRPDRLHRVHEMFRTQIMATWRLQVLTSVTEVILAGNQEYQVVCRDIL